MKLYEILVPADVPLEVHCSWDLKVSELTGGVTILHTALGKWLSREGKLVLEKVLPVRICCEEDAIFTVAELTKEHYKQESVIYYEVSPLARIV